MVTRVNVIAIIENIRQKKWVDLF